MTSRPQYSTSADSERERENGNWLDEFVGWLESLDVPKLSNSQRALVYSVLVVFLVVVVTSVTGHAYLAAKALVEALDGLNMAGITLLVIAVVAFFEVVGVNTTLMALAVGYVYGRRFDDDAAFATLIASAVSFGAVCLGCLVAYALGATVLTDWALELQRRNPVFQALDSVLEEKGFVVNVLLRLTMPDCLVNFAMSTSKCSFPSFALAMFAMLPWIVVHAWYGTNIESLTDQTGGDRDETISLVVGLVATTLLSAVLLVYTKRKLNTMIGDAQRGSPAATASTSARDDDTPRLLEAQTAHTSEA